MTIGSRITAERKRMGLSQEELADKIGVSRQAVSKWETDMSAPDAFNLITLSEVLGTSVEYIVTGKSTTHSESAEDSAKIVDQAAPVSGRRDIAIVGFILVAGGLLAGIVGMFTSYVWSILGLLVIVAGAFLI